MLYMFHTENRENSVKANKNIHNIKMQLLSIPWYFKCVFILFYFYNSNTLLGTVLGILHSFLPLSQPVNCYYLHFLGKEIETIITEILLVCYPLSAERETQPPSSGGPQLFFLYLTIYYGKAYTKVEWKALLTSIYLSPSCNNYQLSYIMNSIHFAHVFCSSFPRGLFCLWGNSVNFAWERKRAWCLWLQWSTRWIEGVEF